MVFEGIEPLLRDHFGFDRLRPHQQEVLTHVAQGFDSIAVLPTGGGKSLLYALPALLRPGLVLVISPLVALIRDQAKRFVNNKIHAVAFESSLSGDERKEIWDQIQAGGVKLLLVSPERLARPDFREKLKEVPIQLVAVDEAHCISHWGSHFRPEYRMLGQYLKDFGKVQKLAVTATATPKVRQDIIESLELTNPKTVWASITRSNLEVKVIKTTTVAGHLETVLHTVLSSEGSGIVYAPTRKMVREVHRMLVNAKVSASAYHAGLANEERHRSQQEFMSGKVKVVVATNAFGMGIDKSDIRFVHHAGLPGSIEGYVQEIGRAGRDGLPARCVLIYGSKDYHIHKFMINKSFPSLADVKQVLKAVRDYLGDGFGESERAVADFVEHRLSHLDQMQVQDILDLLCREELLTRLKSASDLGSYGQDETMITDGHSSRDQLLWSHYEQRLDEQLQKLRAVREYVELSGGGVGQKKYLDHYFQDFENL